MNSCDNGDDNKSPRVSVNVTTVVDDPASSMTPLIADNTINSSSTASTSSLNKNNNNCASIRRVNKIAPLFSAAEVNQEGDEKINKTKKNKKNSSPATIKKKKHSTNAIGILMRPIPGRNFDGFLDRFIKSK